MYFIFGVILLLAAIFQFDIDFVKACVLVLLFILFFGLDLIQDYIKNSGDIKKIIQLNLESKDINNFKNIK